MTLTLYGLKTCDTCRKALKALESGGKSVNFVDIRSGADLGSLLPGWLEAVGADALINRRSTTWRNLDDATRAGDPLSLLKAHPTLIKRPVIDAAGKVTVGWTKDVEARLL